MRPFIKAFLRHSRGATAIEYGMICALIVVAMIASLNGFANKTISMWSNISTTVLAH